MIQLFGSFCGQPASATNPGVFAVGGTPYTPVRSASRSRMPVAASAARSGVGVWAWPGAAREAPMAAPKTTSSVCLMASPSQLASRLLLGRLPVVQEILVAVHRQPRGHRCRTVGGEMPRLFRHVHDVALVGEEHRQRADAVANLPLEN